MFRRATLRCLLVVTIPALAAAGCIEDDTALADGAPADTGRAGDGGVDGAASGADASQPDASLPACDPNADLAPLALDPAYCVTLRFGLEGAPSAFALRADSAYLFDQSATAKTFEVVALPIDPSSGQPGSPSAFFQFSVSSTDDVFASEYVALAPSGMALAVGYNTSSFSDPQGEVYWGPRGATPTPIDADGNYDAAFLDDSTLLLDGPGAGTLDGQGLYVLKQGAAPTRVLKDLGEFSGPVVVSDGAVYASGFFPDAPGSFTGKTRFYGFSKGAIKAAVSGATELSATDDGTLVWEGALTDATAIGDDLIVVEMDDSFAFEGVARVPVQVAADAITPGTQAPLIGKGSAGSVTRVTADGALLGLVIKAADDSAQLAVVTAR